ncbi:unnamed protein product [Phytomonas sp. Hart1]|nr:unnamed protein product [Phytomonas sp. Hart1]|eukprot:CCW71285.1 unnamed protein product [Phytomonas sp. isolate Hart1]
MSSFYLQVCIYCCFLNVYIQNFFPLYYRKPFLLHTVILIDNICISKLNMITTKMLWYQGFPYDILLSSLSFMFYLLCFFDTYLSTYPCTYSSDSIPKLNPPPKINQ